MNYDFRTLCPHDFEALSRDLLSAKFAVDFEIFAPGRDGGIDLISEDNDESSRIVQCKHMRKSSISQLKAKLKSEKHKIESLAPDFYLVSTSKSLTKKNKDEILSLLAPHLKQRDHIFGNEQLNALLREFPNIERSHVKLWAASAEVMKRLIKAEVFKQSEAFVKRAEKKALLYVPSVHFGEALQRLKKDRVLVISGPPGIGKTTLAELLALESVRDGYEVYEVSSDIEDAWGTLGEAKQLFIYDDFLGQNTLDGGELNKNEAQRILNLIERMNSDSNLRLILTTRDYILQHARRSNRGLRDSTFDFLRYPISPEGYSRTIRAKMLFNHIYHSSATESQRRSMADRESYLRIVDHKNFNPRHISDITKRAVRNGCEDLGLYYGELLEKPEEIWGGPFRNDLGNDEKRILFLLATYSYHAPLKLIKEQFLVMSGDEFPVAGFHQALSTLEDNFVSHGPKHGSHSVWFCNPSIKDFVRGEIAAEGKPLLRKLLSSCLDFEQCVYLGEQILGEEPVTVSDYQDLLSAKLKCLFSDGHSPYIIPFGFFSRSFRWLGNEKPGARVPLSSRTRRVGRFISDHCLEERLPDFEARIAKMCTIPSLLCRQGLRTLESLDSLDELFPGFSFVNLKREIASTLRNEVLGHLNDEEAFSAYVELSKRYEGFIEQDRETLIHALREDGVPKLFGEGRAIQPPEDVVEDLAESITKLADCLGIRDSIVDPWPIAQSIVEQAREDEEEDESGDEEEEYAYQMAEEEMELSELDHIFAAIVERE